MKRITLLIILAFWAICGISAPVLSEIVDRLVAVVNGEAITLSMLEDEMNAIWLDPGDVPGFQQEALQRLIDHKLMLLEARKWGVGAVLSEESLSLELAKVASRFTSTKGVSEALKQRGLTREDLEEKLIEKIVIQEMIDRKFRRFLEVDLGEASVYYEQNRERFMIPESVHLNQLFFQLAPDADDKAKELEKEKAVDILNGLKNGGKFSDYSTDDTAVGYVASDQLIPIIAEAVSRMQAGEISDVMETPAGYFIIRLNDRRPARQATFDEVKENIEQILLQQKTDQELKDWLEAQRKAANIRIKLELKTQ